MPDLILGRAVPARAPRADKPTPRYREDKDMPPLINPRLVKELLLKVKGLSDADRYLLAVLFTRALYLKGQDATDFMAGIKEPGK